MQNIIFTGGNGRFGSVLKKSYFNKCTFYLSKKEFNILSLKSMEIKIKKINPKIIVHMAALSRPLSDHYNKRLLVFSLLLAHVSWLILLKFSNSNEILIIIALMISGFASTSLYTVTLAYLGERINVSDIAFATSLFIIIYDNARLRIGWQ